MTREEEIRLQEEFLRALGNAYTIFSTNSVEDYLSEDFYYHSFYVFQELHSKTEYLDYFQKKLYAIQQSGRIYKFKMVYQGNGEPYLMVANFLEKNGYHDGFYAKNDENGKIVELGLMPESLMHISQNKKVVCIRYVEPGLTFVDKLITATYHCDYEYVKELVGSEDFDEKLVHDIGIMGIPFPIYYITKCIKIFLSQDFSDKVMPLVRNLKDRSDKLCIFWQKKFGIDLKEKIDYRKYGQEHIFYCTDNEETIEDLFCNPIKSFLDNNCRMIDLLLYDAICRFQFENVEVLLESGANPDAILLPVKGWKEDDPFNCMRRIGDECSYLRVCEIIPILRFMPQTWYTKNYKITAKDIGDLLGWAAHKEMMDLLLKYIKE